MVTNVTPSRTESSLAKKYGSIAVSLRVNRRVGNGNIQNHKAKVKFASQPSAGKLTAE
jgi:hypothetical protein